ncbi:MAG: multidrug ABC transporter ATP-binding protein, partial [Anaerolineae bacterium]
FVEAVRALPFVDACEARQNKLVCTLDNPEGRNPDLVRFLVGQGADIQFVGELRRSLEDVYLRLIGEQRS